MATKAYSYIRMSTKEQKEGHRRQLKMSNDYIRKNGLELDTSIDLTDIGQSAYHGAHKSKGQLGKFLELVNEGRIPAGSVLIVEHLDRLSREQVSTALEQFIAILNRQIKIVTLKDGKEYTKDSISKDWTQLIISITYMAKAHQESKDKGDRLKEKWVHKRKKAADGKPMTGMCPAWLELSEDGEFFEVKEDVAEAINLIYQMKLAGKGTYSIEQELNKSDIWSPPQSNRNKTGGWRRSYINKILSNPAVHGEFQPHRIERVQDIKTGEEKKKRVPAGDPIPDYYPEIVPKKIFDRVAEIRAHNRKTGKHRGGGQTGKVSNLFTHLIKCGECDDSSMIYDNKGEYQYLRCDANKRGLGCQTSETIRYDYFEPLILHFTKKLSVESILSSDSQKQSEIASLRKEVQANEGELAEIKKKIENLDLAIAESDNKKQRERHNINQSKLIDREAELDKEQSKLRAQIQNLENRKEEAG